MTTPKRILVVEDDESIRAVLDMALSDEGYEVIEAENGAQGLALARTTQPHVILLDMRMPVMDGWAVARALRGQGITVPIIVMTAAESARRWADEVGAEGYLAKPFGLDELLATVERFRGSEGRAN